MPRRKRQGVAHTHYWTVVRSALYCWMGAHTAEPGVWMRFLKGDPARRGSCEACLNARGVYRPERKVTMNGDFDPRARQAGGDE